MKTIEEMTSTVQNGDSYTINVDVDFRFGLQPGDFVHTRGDHDMWTREGTKHTARCNLILTSESQKPEFFNLGIIVTHSEDRPDYSTWVATKNFKIPIDLKENEYFMRFLQGGEADPDELSLRWDTSVSGRPNTSRGGDHGYFGVSRRDYVVSGKARIDGHGNDDGVQYFSAILKIPYRVFVDV